jgi:hypothetical protein
MHVMNDPQANARASQRTFFRHFLTARAADELSVSSYSRSRYNNTA